jgi:hypothetical protein
MPSAPFRPGVQEPGARVGGIADPDRAPLTVERLMAEDMFSLRLEQTANGVAVRILDIQGDLDVVVRLKPLPIHRPPLAAAV